MGLLPGFHPSLKSGNKTVFHSHCVWTPFVLSLCHGSSWCHGQPVAAWHIFVRPCHAGPYGFPAFTFSTCAEEVVQWAARVIQGRGGPCREVQLLKPVLPHDQR